MSAVSIPPGRRGRLGVLVSAGLVVLLGIVGVVAGKEAGDKAIDVHRDDRLYMQRVNTDLLDQYTQVSAAEILDLLRGEQTAGRAPFSATADDPADLERLARLAGGSRAMNAGAVLVSGAGQPLVAYSAEGDLPGRDDPGWLPLFASATSDRQSAPVSGVLHAGRRPMTAVAVPAQLSDGTTGMLVGLAKIGDGGLQAYTSELGSGDSREGYVVDGAGLVIAGPGGFGEPLPFPKLLAQMRQSEYGVLETSEPGTASVVTYARGPISGWTMLTTQDRGAFMGGLEESNRRAQVALVLLLLGAGTTMLVLHRKREHALHTAATRDELTGALNRRGWFGLAEQELERARRHGSERVLLFVDVDGLKLVNDVLGHREGDRAVTDAGRLLTAAFRASDLVGRLGGDEFVLMLGEGGDAAVAEHRLSQALSEHNATSGRSFELRLSVGTERWTPAAPCTLDELVRRADAVMYASKSSRPTRAHGIVRVPPPRGATRDCPDLPRRAAKVYPFPAARSASHATGAEPSDVAAGGGVVGARAERQGESRDGRS